MPEFTAPGPLPTETIRGAIRTIEPAWSVLDAAAVDGSDAVYHVTADTAEGPRDLVLKVRRDVDPASVRPEPYLLDAVDRRTSVPVPTVVGAVDDADEVPDHHDDLPVPFFVMDRCPGHTFRDELDGVPDRIRERVARQAGRYLGELHQLGSFDGFGDVRLRADANGGRGLVGPGYALTVDEHARDAWPAQFRDRTGFFVSHLDERFADLAPAVRSFLDDGRDRIPREVRPALSHGDYRFRNLLVDPDTGDTTAVLDFADGFTAHGEYDLVGAEDRLSGYAPVDSGRRRRVREAIQEGYRETADLDPRRLADYRDLYLLAGRLPAMVRFRESVAVSGHDADELARRHRAFVRSIAG